MVHGNYYGVRYEIYLNKELDLFNDILPICIDVRKMLSLEKVSKNSNQYKLVVIPYRETDSRFEKIANVHKYIESNDTISYNHIITRKSHPEVFKYYDVKIYKSFLKYNKCPEPFTQEELKKSEKRFQDLIDILNSEDFWNKSQEERKEIAIEQDNLRQTLNIQRIIINYSYFDEIKHLERELTDIKLTQEEEEVVSQILHHPKLVNFILTYGMNLIEGYY